MDLRLAEQLRQRRQVNLPPALTLELCLAAYRQRYAEIVTAGALGLQLPAARVFQLRSGQPESVAFSTSLCAGRFAIRPQHRGGHSRLLRARLRRRVAPS